MREYGKGIEPGTRVEISPHFDLWMRGAKYGTVVKIVSDEVHIKMDHPQVKRIVKAWKYDVRLA